MDVLISFTLCVFISSAASVYVSAPVVLLLCCSNIALATPRGGPKSSAKIMRHNCLFRTCCLLLLWLLLLIAFGSTNTAVWTWLSCVLFWCGFLFLFCLWACEFAHCRNACVIFTNMHVYVLKCLFAKVLRIVYLCICMHMHMNLHFCCAVLSACCLGQSGVKWVPVVVCFHCWLILWVCCKYATYKYTYVYDNVNNYVNICVIKARHYQLKRQ